MPGRLAELPLTHPLPSTQPPSSATDPVDSHIQICWEEGGGGGRGRGRGRGEGWREEWVEVTDSPGKLCIEYMSPDNTSKVFLQCLPTDITEW